MELIEKVKQEKSEELIQSFDSKINQINHNNRVYKCDLENIIDIEGLLILQDAHILGYKDMSTGNSTSSNHTVNQLTSLLRAIKVHRGNLKLKKYNLLNTIKSYSTENDVITCIELDITL